MNTKTKYIILGSLSLLAVGFGSYFAYQWYTLKTYYERKGTVDEVNASVADSAKKLGVTAADDYEPDDAVKSGSGDIVEESQIAIINNETFFLNTDDGIYVSASGNIYDPSTDSLTTTGDNAVSTHIDKSQVQLTTN